MQFLRGNYIFPFEFCVVQIGVGPDRTNISQARFLEKWKSQVWMSMKGCQNYSWAPHTSWMGRNKDFILLSTRPAFDENRPILVTQNKPALFVGISSSRL